MVCGLGLIVAVSLKGSTKNVVCAKHEVLTWKQGISGHCSVFWAVSALYVSKSVSNPSVVFVWLLQCLCILYSVWVGRDVDAGGKPARSSGHREEILNQAGCKNHMVSHIITRCWFFSQKVLSETGFLILGVYLSDLGTHVGHLILEQCMASGLKRFKFETHCFMFESP